MVDVDGLSDAEIRTKLMEFGYPVMPITGTTRKLMVKKLKLLIENKNKNANDKRSLGRYSSEEESDGDVVKTTTSRKDKNVRRITVAVPPKTGGGGTTLLRKSHLRRHDANDSSFIEPADVIKTTNKSTTTTTTKVFKSVKDEFDTGSDSEPENDYEPFTNNENYKKDSSSPYSTYSPPKLSATSSSIYTSSTFSNKPASPSRYTTTTTTYNAPSAAGDDSALDRLNQIRSRLSLGGSSVGPERSPPPPRLLSYDDNHTKEDKTGAGVPFLSNFTRRLSQLSNAKSTKPEFDFKNSDVIKEHDTMTMMTTNNGASSAYAPRTYLGRSRYRGPVGREHYSRRHGNFLKDNAVSIGVFGAALLFFLFVGAVYWGMMRGNEAALDAPDYNVPRCVAADPSSKHGVNCVRESDLEGAIKLLTVIKPELIRRAVAYVCSDTHYVKQSPFMPETDVIDFHHKQSGEDLVRAQQHLAHLEVLVFHNPKWGVSVVTSEGEDVLASMDEVIELRPEKTIALAALRPDVPWRCTVYNKLRAVFNSLLVLAATFFALYFCNLAYKHVRRHRQRQKDEICAMVERIVDTLQANVGNGGGEGDDFLVINHVRDMILPIVDRKRMEQTWVEAVKFINEHESRVRTEVQFVQGEPFEVWRWLGSPSLNTSSSPRSKTWQGQAFETQIGSVNSLPCSPTPCLKIRGMVDENERNFQAIREAVLNKCAHQCRILHCAVDAASKCVYLKCADQNDAAVAYRNLHGWWYAGHLVTVKYLRLERYMQRFGDSPASGPPYLKALSPATDWSS